jgi:hypothetical protein
MLPSGFPTLILHNLLCLLYVLHDVGLFLNHDHTLTVPHTLQARARNVKGKSIIHPFIKYEWTFVVRFAILIHIRMSLDQWFSNFRQSRTTSYAVGGTRGPPS